MSKTDLARPFNRRLSVAIGGGAILAMIGFTAACSSESEAPEESPTTTTTTTTTTTSAAPTVSPTENLPNPNVSGVFTPPVGAPQPTLDTDRDDYGY